MKYSNLNEIAVFVEVAKAGGFRAAAKTLNMGPGSVSQAIQRLEDRLGVRLFERSTRSVVLTPTGERLFEHSGPAIIDLETALREVNDGSEEVSGSLRLNAPYSAASFFLNDLLAKFSIQFPKVLLEVSYSDDKVDLVTGSVDAAVRDQNLVDLDTYALPIGPKLEMSVVASAEYLANNGTPKNPSDLSGHDCICYAFSGTEMLAPWIFESKNGRYEVVPNVRIIVNDMPSMIPIAKKGIGIAYVYKEIAIESIKNKQLISLFPNQLPILPPYSLNYRTKRNMPKTLRAFIDFVRSEYG